ncbi:transmembrane protein 238 [Aulostomus maculatus]
MEPSRRGLGRCASCFWLAVAFDLGGLLVLLSGVFVDVFFYDLLIYAGAIVIFLSLVWWVFWYSGNIEVAPADLEDDVGLVARDKRGEGGIGAAVRRLSGRVTAGIRSSLRRNRAPASARTALGRGSAGAPQVVVAMATKTANTVELPHTETAAT